MLESIPSTSEVRSRVTLPASPQVPLAIYSHNELISFVIVWPAIVIETSAFASCQDSAAVIIARSLPSLVSSVKPVKISPVQLKPMMIFVVVLRRKEGGYVAG